MDVAILRELERFEESNPSAEYFILDGNHRTTALTLNGRRIISLVYEDDKDIEKAKTLVADGQVLQSETLQFTLEENCRILNTHFRNDLRFMTVKEKTEKMIKEKVLPKEIIDDIV